MKLLILYIDGLRYDYHTKMDFLRELSKESLYGKLKPEFGFTSNLGAFFTGKKPEEHGYFAHVVLNDKSIFRWTKILMPIFKLLEKVNKKVSRFTLFSILNLYLIFKGRHYIIKLDGIPLELIPYLDITIKSHYYEPECFKTENLFDYFRDKYKFHFYMWPFYGTNKKTKFELPLINNDNYRFKKFKKIFNKEGDIYFVQFWDLDKNAHNTNINSKEFLRYIKEADYMIKYFVTRFDGDIIIWTDHGMTEVEKSINIKEILDKLDLKLGKDYLYFLDSTLARFWFKNEKAKKTILTAISKTELIEVDKNLKDQYGVNFKDNKYGDVMFTVKPGTIIFPDFYNSFKAPKNMHGFLPETETEQGFYLIRSNKIKNGNKNLMIRNLFDIIMRITK